MLCRRLSPAPLFFGTYRPLLAAIGLVLLSAVSEARTWNVHQDGTGDAPTVQAGLDSAQSGDVVLIKGTFTWTTEGASGETMLRMKRDVRLVGYIHATLDAEGRGRVITCVDVGNAEIRQVTISGGLVSGPDARGGGILVIGDSNLYMEGCHVKANRVDGSSARGAGIFIEGGTIKHCYVYSNTGAGDDVEGGGIASLNTVVTDLVWVWDNRVTGGAVGARGAGIAASGGEIRYAWAWDNWNEGSANGGQGGGLYLRGSTVDNCWITENRAPQGGGIYCYGADIRHCTVVNNRATDNIGIVPGLVGGGAGIAAGPDDAPSQVTGCTVRSNIAIVSGGTAVGGIALMSGGTVRRSIIADSQGDGCSGPVTFECCDVWGNTGSNALSGFDAGGNFSADPQFCCADGHYCFSPIIQSDSPCAPENHPLGSSSCGLIGAGEIGCSETAVRHLTWSEIKEMFR